MVLTVNEGSIIKREAGANITRGGSSVITFDKGVLQSSESESVLTANYNPAGNDTIQLMGDNSFRAEPGNVLHDITVNASRNRIEGQPTFENSPGITLQDFRVTLTIAIQSKLNQNIDLNGGTLYLGDDLSLADDVRLTGGGTVFLRGRQLEFGGKDTTWSEDIFWDNANDMVLNSKLSVTGTWTFAGESHITGNGNILDLTDSGTLWIKSGATVHLRDIKLKGLGIGRIVFEDRSSQIRLSDSQIELDANYVVTEGGFYVDGESTIYVKNHILSFEQRGSMTVDGTCLWYDLLDEESKVQELDGIKPVEADDINHKYIEFLNSGIIRRVIGGKHGPIIWSGVNYLHEDLWLSPDQRAIVVDDKVVFGRSHSIHFSRTSDNIHLPLIEILPGKKLTFLNIVLENFSPKHVELGLDSAISFSDKTTIELGTDVDLNQTWTFVGNCVLRGKGHRLTLGTNGNIVVARSDVRRSSLLLDDLEIDGIRGNRIRCLDNTGTVSFMNVKWMQDANFSLTVGHFEALGACNMSGKDYKFAYETDQTSYIFGDGLLYLDTGFTFSYAPSISSSTLINIASTGQFFMNGATLHSTKPGLQFSTGTLIFDHKNYLISDASVKTDAIKINGLYADVEIMPGAGVELLRGFLDYQYPTP